MSRIGPIAFALIATVALVPLAAVPAEAQFPKGKCFEGYWILRVDDGVWQCSDLLRFGTAYLTSECFSDRGPYSIVADDEVLEIVFSGMKLPPDSFFFSGGPFDGTILIDRRGASGSLAATFKGKATDIFDVNGPAPSNGGFYGIQRTCDMDPMRVSSAPIGVWQRLID